MFFKGFEWVFITLFFSHPTLKHFVGYSAEKIVAGVNKGPDKVVEQKDFDRVLDGGDGSVVVSVALGSDEVCACPSYVCDVKGLIRYQMR